MLPVTASVVCWADTDTEDGFVFPKRTVNSRWNAAPCPEPIPLSSRFDAIQPTVQPTVQQPSASSTAVAPCTRSGIYNNIINGVRDPYRYEVLRVPIRPHY